MANSKPTYYQSGLIGVAKPSGVANPSGVARPSRMSRSSRMSKANKQWLRLANERLDESLAQHMTDSDKIAWMKRRASGQAPPSIRKSKSEINPKPGIGTGGTRRTRRKGVKVYARKRRGSAYSLKPVFNF